MNVLNRGYPFEEIVFEPEMNQNYSYMGRKISHQNKPTRCAPHFGSSKRGSLGKLQRVLNHIRSTSMNYNDHRRHNTSLVHDPCVYATSCRKYGSRVYIYTLQYE